MAQYRACSTVALPNLPSAALLVLGVAVMGSPVTGSAQTVITQTGGAIQADPGNANYPRCAQPTSCFVLSADGLAQTFSAAYATVGGPLGATATATASGFGLPNANLGAGAVAGFTDVFTLSNVPPGATAQFTIHLTGNANQSGGCQSFGSQWNGVPQLGPLDVGPSPCPFYSGNNLSLFLDYDLGNPLRPPRQHFVPAPLSNWTNVAGAYDGLYSVSVPVAPGIVDIRTTLEVQAFLYRAAGPITGTASTDFYSTAVLNAIVFYDASGVDISNQVGFSAASGVVYPIGGAGGNAATVPEPGTAGLVLIGCLVIPLLGRMHQIASV